MPFSTVEESTHGGQPDEVYVFAVGGDIQRYTSSDADVVYEGETYVAVPIQRGEISLDSEIDKSNLSIQVDFNFPLLEAYMVIPPDVVVEITVYRKHGEVVDSDDYAPIWKGRVASVSWKEVNAEIECENLATSLKAPGLRRPYTKGCPFRIYDLDCKVNEETYKVDGSAVAVTNNTVQVAEAAGQPDGYYSGGFIEWDGQYGNKNSRTITNHVGQILTVLSSTWPMAALDSVSIYPGCGQNSSECNGKFNNMPNYGGFKNKPNKDPSKDQVF